MQSKLRFRNVFPDVAKERYEQVQPSTSSSDSGLIKGNSKYVAFAWKAGGGGSLAILDMNKPQRLSPVVPVIKGHTGAIQDQDFNPFNDNVIATASDDTTVKVWEIPEDFSKDVTDPLCTLAGHGRKVNFLQFHPAAEQILASSSNDSTVKIWDVERQKEAFTLTAPETNYWCLSWNTDGSLLATTSKDKLTRIGDPRAEKWVCEVLSHEGSRAQKLTYIGDTGLLLTVGFAKSTDREFKLWDLKNLKDPIQSVKIDQQASVLFPFYDADVGMLYLAGRGDGNIRYYEFSDGTFSYTSDHKSTTPQKGIGFIPKRGVNVMRNELMRALKLADNYIEFISFIQPRKASSFQEDLFPDCFSENPAQSAEAWIAGNNAAPLRRSLKPDATTSLTQNPKPVSRPSVTQVINPEVEKLRKALEEAHQEIKALKSQQAAQNQSTQHGAELEKLKDEINVLYEAKISLEHKLNHQVTIRSELEQKLDEKLAENTSDNSAVVIEELTAKVSNLKETIVELSTTIDAKTHLEHSLQSEIENLKASTDTLQAQVQEKERSG